MNLRLVSVAGVALLALSCSNRYRQQRISPDAAALFARAEAPGPGGSLVLNLEGMRELNLISARADGRSAEDRSALTDLLIASLATGAAQIDDPRTSQLLSRIAVLAAILREWGIWPQVQRLGVFVPMPDGPLDLMDPQRMMDHAFIVIATKSDAAATRELLRGLAAADRATGVAHLSASDGLLCARHTALPSVLCLKAGSGYLALGTPAALKGIEAPQIAASEAPGSPVARLRLDMPGVGKSELLVDGRSSLRLAASVQTADPDMAAQLLAAAKDFLKKMDDSHERTRALLTGSLEQVQQAVAVDREAPGGMKAAARRMTVDRLLNSRGEYGQLRGSMQLAAKDGVFRAELTVPEAQVRSFTESSSMASAVALTGMVAAIAIPNLVRSGAVLQRPPGERSGPPRIKVGRANEEAPRERAAR